MILRPEQVLSIALSSTDEWIKTAREDSARLRMHYYGENVVQYITQIEGLENDKQVELRQKVKISNEYIVNNLLKPFENLFSAKGGGFSYEISKATKEEAFIEKVNELGHKAYIQNIYFSHYITDPNGLLFVENNKNEAYPTYKSSGSIKNMKLKGEIPEYVCFEVDKEEKDENGQVTESVLWLVDDAFYYRVKLHNGTASILEPSLKNIYGTVPAIINSGIVDTLRGVRLSPIHKQIDLLDSFLRKNTIKEVYQLKHDFPVYWEYESVCPDCKGAGMIDAKTCITCNGTGKASKKNVGDTRTLKIPTGDSPKLAPDVVGWVNPPWAGEHQRTELKEVFNDMFYSLWGATIEKAQNETATGRFIDVQPVNNTLTNQVDIIQPRHNRMLTLQCMFYFPEQVKSVQYVYGDRYLIETPDQLLEKYNKAKTGNAPDIVKTQILEQYIESEYRRDDLMRKYNLKLIEITPFVHMTVQEVVELPVSDLDKLKKIYFSEWLAGKMINAIIDKPAIDLLTDLAMFAGSKQIETNVTKQP